MREQERLVKPGSTHPTRAPSLPTTSIYHSHSAMRPTLIPAPLSACCVAVLQALADTHLRELPNRLWIVCEDAAAPNETVRHVLNASGVEHVYLARGPTRRKGHEQRSLAYEYIRRHRLAGVVYNMDDDNSYAHALWSELRMVRRGRVAVHCCLRRPLDEGQLRRRRGSGEAAHSTGWLG